MNPTASFVFSLEHILSWWYWQPGWRGRSTMSDEYSTTLFYAPAMSTRNNLQDNRCTTQHATQVAYPDLKSWSIYHASIGLSFLLCTYTSRPKNARFMSLKQFLWAGLANAFHCKKVVIAHSSDTDSQEKVVKMDSCRVCQFSLKYSAFFFVTTSFLKLVGMKVNIKFDSRIHQIKQIKFILFYLPLHLIGILFL